MIQIMAALFFSLVATVAAAQTPVCQGGAQVLLTAEMIFGRNIGARLGVSEAQWRRFLDREVTPRFPVGFTVVDVSGQYRESRRGRIIREPGKMLIVAAADDDLNRARLAALADIYKRRFRQESVVTILRSACVSF